MLTNTTHLFAVTLSVSRWVFLVLSRDGSWVMASSSLCSVQVVSTVGASLVEVLLMVTIRALSRARVR